ncbi:sensor histidine kinase [Cronbergia sp. UHCC 0137]|uniref:sensor histidine kinase n=1 Tax=Cronbergia sp. UHCC 0137 TaxID=3110239 RepID=UPI002B1EF2FD|nr:sensor histidine kinase [Cronbergia sp. UHCC 0137]MEA5619143.1 sensor histidine kinase [Cronbergia sp. UHCC 0137]
MFNILGWRTFAIATVIMSQASESQSSLLPLLANLESLLLGIVAIAQIIVTLFSSLPNLLFINLLGLGCFTALGRIKPHQTFSKLMYTLIEFCLIFYLAIVSNIALPTALFVVLVIRNCLLWEGGYRNWVTILSLFGAIGTLTHKLSNEILLFNFHSEQIVLSWIALSITFSLGILFLQLLVDAGLKEQQRQKELAIANTRLRQYALRVEELATVQERNRIARDIHDSLGHSLTVFGIHLEGALRLLKSDPAQAEELLLEIKQLNTTTLREVRESVSALRSDPLQEKNLEEAIAILITDFHKSTGVLPALDNQLKATLSHDRNIVIYRILQESLTNVRKYAAATTVNIVIAQSIQDVQITIEDNGQGFDLSQNATGFGLQGMRERVLALMGQLEIFTAPNQGCRIIATLPLSEHIG